MPRNSPESSITARTKAATSTSETFPQNFATDVQLRFLDGFCIIKFVA